jgi:hypothetical protein
VILSGLRVYRAKVPKFDLYTPSHAYAQRRDLSLEHAKRRKIVEFLSHWDDPCNHHQIGPGKDTTLQVGTKQHIRGNMKFCNFEQNKGSRVFVACKQGSEWL